MDCRRSLQIASLGLLSLSAWLASGCTTTTQQVITPQPPTAQKAAMNLKKEEDLPKITPKASSCVAGAELLRVEANGDKYTQSQKDEFRDRARKGYEQALRLEPKNTAAQLGIARLYYDMNDHDHAVAAYEKALKQDPKNVVLHYELGMVHARSKEWDAAVAHLRTSYELDPNNKDSATTYGHCLARSGRIDEAYNVFCRTVGEARAHYNLARMLHHMNRDDLCRQQLDLALRADPQLTDARDLLVSLSVRPTQGSAQ
jgi:tetratricopeptide (TPR) repeat protein